MFVKLVLLLTVLVLSIGGHVARGEDSPVINTNCNCNEKGSYSNSCDSTGQCPCRANVEGTKCDTCAENHYGIDSGNGCSACGCNEYGVVYNRVVPANPGERERNMTCDNVTGQCHCQAYFKGRREMIEQKKYESRTCDGCPALQYLSGTTTGTCTDCNCHPEGSRSLQCDLYTGDCKCNPGITGNLCDTRDCEWGLWSYNRECIITNFVRCTGYGWKTRSQFSTPFWNPTITKVAECNRKETAKYRCRERRC